MDTLFTYSNGFIAIVFVAAFYYIKKDIIQREKNVVYRIDHTNKYLGEIKTELKTELSWVYKEISDIKTELSTTKESITAIKESITAINNRSSSIEDIIEKQKHTCDNVRKFHNEAILSLTDEIKDTNTKLSELELKTIPARKRKPF